MQIRPSDWGEALKNKCFKESLIGFLIEAWKNDSCARILKSKTVYANYNNLCYKYRAENRVTIYTEEEQVFSTHEQAGKRTFFDLNHALPGSTVVLRTDDTDSLMIALDYNYFFNSFET